MTAAPNKCQPEGKTAMTDARGELLALADRIERVAAFSGLELGAPIKDVDAPKGSGKLDALVILINAKWRSTLISALRAAPVPQCEAEPVAWRIRPDNMPWLLVGYSITDDESVVKLWREAGRIIEPLYPAPPSRSDAGSAEALRDVRTLLQAIYDLIDDEETAEPLDYAIAHAKKALAILDTAALVPPPSWAGRALVQGTTEAPKQRSGHRSAEDDAT